MRTQKHLRPYPSGKPCATAFLPQGRIIGSCAKTGCLTRLTALRMAGCSACNTSSLLMTAAAPAMVMAFSSWHGPPAVNAMTVTNGLFTLINVDADMPLRIGRCMSMITTSGLSLAARRIASSPLTASPTTLKSSYLLDQFTQNLPNERMVIHEKNLYWLRMRRLAVFVKHAGAPIRCVYQEKCTGKDARVLVNQGNATEGATIWSRLLSHNEPNEGSLKTKKLLVDAYARGEVRVDALWRVATVTITGDIAFFRSQEISHEALSAGDLTGRL